MADARVTLAVVPRERFSCVPRTLETLYEHTPPPFELVYVDGGSPRRIRRYLERASQQHGFRLIRTERHLSPNEARNLALQQARTEYVVFIDNDVSVAPGWLDKLMECADETGAAVVGPLTCIGEPEHQVIHLAGGDVEIEEEPEDGRVHRRVRERMYFPGRKVADVRAELRRQECRLAEFHCMLARRSLFDQIGPFDEGMLNTREHLDFCLEVHRAGGTVWFEPDSVVTYVPGPPFALRDVGFYMLRWSDDWERRSLMHFAQKWDLPQDDFFRRRYERLGWRRHNSLVEPAVRKLTLGRGSRLLERVLKRSDRILNRYLTRRHAHLEAKATR
jgi:glycosyltransferase involved in cell wall biosynthesis